MTTALITYFLASGPAPNPTHMLRAYDLPDGVEKSNVDIKFGLAPCIFNSPRGGFPLIYIFESISHIHLQQL